MTGAIHEGFGGDESARMMNDLQAAAATASSCSSNRRFRLVDAFPRHKDEIITRSCQFTKTKRTTIRWSSSATTMLFTVALLFGYCWTTVEAQVITPAPMQQQQTRPPTPRPPTRAPVSPPTPPPTRVPTFPPTRRPTSAPTRRPTFVPTSNPTPQPTSVPTGRPTSNPTLSPTRIPTSQPTSIPTSIPTSLPTAIPTSTPTRMPSSTPSRGPTNAPTSVPTAQPSLSPSTGVPSFRPSQRPSPEPSEPPTFRPTTFTPAPTRTYRPTRSPSATPTTVPSVSPTATPSAIPSVAPTPLPSASPSSAPTLSKQLYEIDSVMRLISMDDTMDSGARIDWEGSTAAHIRNIMERVPVEEEIIQLDVITDISSQVLLIPQEEPANDSGSDNNNQRFLQAEGEDSAPSPTVYPLQVEFLVRVTFRSVRNDIDLVELIGQAFNSADERQQYISRLKQLNDAFDDVQRVDILINGTVPREEIIPGIQDNEDEGDGSTLIIAVAAGAVVLAVAAFGFIAWRRFGGKNGVDNGHRRNRLEDPTKAETDPTAQMGYTAEILVERQDDVSTLGDPVYGMMTTTAAERDEATASVGNDYDYSKQYLKAQGISSMTDQSSRGRLASTDSESKRSQRTGMIAPPSVFSDDASFEQQFSISADTDFRLEITVPPGKLGMVIDTPQGGVPLVHAIKPASILSNQVHVNDRLISVDGEDVTHMTAVQVSKLISLKADQTRVLVFCRPRERTDSR